MSATPDAKAITDALVKAITDMLMHSIRIELALQIKAAAEDYKLPAEAVDMEAAKLAAERRVAKHLRFLADHLDA